MCRATEFRFPYVSWQSHGRQLLSFHRSALEVLGEYSPDQGAVVVNPIWTGTKCPDATADHETQHQFLSINTSFGFLTQLITHLAQLGAAPSVFQECIRTQWCTQELAATYSEISLIAAEFPELFEESVRSLPSLQLNQPPYRELFDEMQQHLEIHPRKTKDVLIAQATLVIMLAFASMNSDCLLRIQSERKDETGLSACMQDFPDHRFEQIATYQNLIDTLLKEAMELPSREQKRATIAQLFLRRIIELVPEVTIESEEAFAKQADTIVAEWNVDGKKFELKRLNRDPFPKVQDSVHRLVRIFSERPSPKLPAHVLRKRLKETCERSLGLCLGLTLRSPTWAVVTARSYFLKQGEVPLPIDSEDETPQTSLPEYLRGIMPVPQLLRQLMPFPFLPHVVVFADDSWRRWQEVPRAQNGFITSILVFCQTDLSYEEVRDNLLAFESLNYDKGARCFVIKHSSERFVGCFFNPLCQRVFALQRLPSDYARRLFGTICEKLGVLKCDDALATVPEVPLLTMISGLYLW